MKNNFKLVLSNKTGMKFFNLLTFCLIIFLLAILFSSKSKNSDDEFQLKPGTLSYPEKITLSQPIFYKLAESYPSLNIAVAERGKIIWSEAKGFADIENKRLATPQTLYPIYSVSKGLTGILTAALESSGKLDINQSVRSYLPKLPKHYQPVTSKHLLGHTGGIRHYRDARENYPQDGEWMQIAARHCKSPGEILPLFVSDKLVSKPGDYRNYTTFGYVLLSAVLETAGGKKYTELMQTLVFDKAGASGIRLDRSGRNELERATLYRDSWNGYQKIPSIDNSCRFGGGGFVARATDLALIASIYADARIVDETKMQKIATPLLPAKESSSTGYGFNVSKKKLAAGEITILTNGGAGLGARAYLYIIQHKGIAVALTGNVKGEEMNNGAETIAKIFADYD